MSVEMGREPRGGGSIGDCFTRVISSTPLETYAMPCDSNCFHVAPQSGNIVEKGLLLFSCSVMSDSLQPHGLQHAMLPWPSLSLRVCSNSCPIELMMPSKHLILSHPLLLLPSIFPSIRVYYNELALRIRWLKCWSFSISPSKSFRKLRAPLMPHAWDLSAAWHSLSPPLSLFLPTLKSQCLPFPSFPLPVPAFTLAAFRMCVSDKASVKAASTLQPKSPPPPA